MYTSFWILSGEMPLSPVLLQKAIGDGLCRIAHDSLVHYDRLAGQGVTEPSGPPQCSQVEQSGVSEPVKTLPG